MKNSVNYIFWLFFFLLILGLIPVSLLLNQVFLAKALGILAVVSLSFALWVWKRQLAEKFGANNRIKVNLNDVFWLNQHVPFYTNLSKSDKIVFENRLGLFLGAINFRTTLKDKEGKEALLFLGSSAIQAFWGFPPIAFVSIESIGISPVEQDLIMDSTGQPLMYNVVFSLPRVKESLINGSCKELWKPVFSLEQDYFLSVSQRMEESKFHYEVFLAWRN
jgi:hypothetical protein